MFFCPKSPNLGIWAKNFRKQMSDLKSSPSKPGTGKTSLRLMIRFGTKYPSLGGLGFQFLKDNIRFKISTFKTRFMRNIIKIRYLILLAPKGPNMGIWTQNLKNENH